MRHPDLQASSEDLITAEEAARPTSVYYGWVMLPLSMAALIASSPGQTFGVSIFNEPMRLSLGLTHGQLAFAYAVGTIVGAVPITFIGATMDRRGLRTTMLVVVSLFSAACLLTAFTQGLLTLIVAFGLLRMLGPGALAFLSGNTLPFWFERRLGTVEGFRQVGMAAAMAIVPALNLFLVASFGWRVGYAILGGAIWCLLFPVFAIFFRNHPDEVGQVLDGRKPELESPLIKPSKEGTLSWGLSLKESMHTRSFWIVTAGTSMFALIHTAVFFCLVPILQERGLSGRDAATLLTIFAIFMAIAQVVGGMLADRVRAQPLLFLGSLGLGLSMFLLLWSTTPAAAYLSGAVLGISQGLYFGTANPLWARYFGRRHLGKIRGALITLQIGASSFGPLMAGLARDYSGDFGGVLTAFALAPLPIATLSLLAAPPKRVAVEASDPLLSTASVA
ncbi:MAG: MFS transporter [Pirellulales bacterium]